MPVTVAIAVTSSSRCRVEIAPRCMCSTRARNRLVEAVFCCANCRYFLHVLDYGVFGLQKKGASLKRKQQNYAEVLQRQTSLEKRTRN
jgi:hypothetical protein